MTWSKEDKFQPVRPPFRPREQDHALELGRQTWDAREVLGLEKRPNVTGSMTNWWLCNRSRAEGGHAEHRQDGASE